MTPGVSRGHIGATTKGAELGPQCITATVTHHGAWGMGRTIAESSGVPYSWPIKAAQQHSPITEVLHEVEAHDRITLSETTRNIWTNQSSDVAAGAVL